MASPPSESRPVHGPKIGTLLLTAKRVRKLSSAAAFVAGSKPTIRQTALGGRLDSGGNVNSIAFCSFQRFVGNSGSYKSTVPLVTLRNSMYSSLGFWRRSGLPSKKVFVGANMISLITTGPTFGG